MTNRLKQLSEAATEETIRQRVHSAMCHLNALLNNGGHTVYGLWLSDLIALLPALETQLKEARAREAVAYEVAADRVERAGHGLHVELRHMAPDHTTTALEQIKQEARDEGKREAIALVQSEYLDWKGNGFGSEALAISRARDAILATLSADTQENSDE